MSHRPALGLTTLVLGTLVLGMVLFPGTGSAQASPPLTATLVLENPPPNMTFDGTTPIKINLALTNSSGAPILTTDGFSSTDFWRLLYFALDGVGIITNAAAATSHHDTPYGTCHYRNSVLLAGPGIPVVPTEVVPADFGLLFSFDDVRQHFDLTHAGHYTVTARISLLAYDPSAVIADCDIEFNGKSLLSISADLGTAGRQEFEIVSNSLEFFIQPLDSTPPTTTVVLMPAANAAGWNNQDVTLDFTAADNPGGSGVKDISLIFFGAQANPPQTISGASGSVTIGTEGTTTVFFNAEDNAGNQESIRPETVRVDKTPPAVTPPASASVAATETGGARASASPALAAFLAGGGAKDNLDPSPVSLGPQVNGVTVGPSTLFPLGSTIVTFRFSDVAGNVGTANASVTVGSGMPAISGTVGTTGAVNKSIHFYDLTFTNTGTAPASNVMLTQFNFKTLAGHGNVSYDSTRSPKLPIALGNLAIGASQTVRVFLAVPPPVKQFTITESGQFQDSTGTTSPFSTTETVSP